MKITLLLSFTILIIFEKLSRPVSCNPVGCTSLIFCQGDLLRIVQTAGIFKDSKTFVDMSMSETAEKTLKAFEMMMAISHGHPSQLQVLEFVQKHFHASSNELEGWHPIDHQVNPPFLRKIRDLKIRAISKHISDRWPILGRRIRKEVLKNSIKYSIIPVAHGFIIPGGRFREFYYWDSYWIIKGLLLCDMTKTAKGMLKNFLSIIDKHGFIPNGGRIYYLDRSQPPLLTLMVADYVEKTHEITWLRNNIHHLDKEMTYWLKTKTVMIDRNGLTYELARYISSQNTPRPESYIEDVRTADKFSTEEERRNVYQYLRTGAETGWDFSSRWFFDRRGGNADSLSSINPTRILPVDLNAFLCKCFKVLYNYHQRFHNTEKANFYYKKWKDWLHAIEDVLYNEQDGIWYDYDIEHQQQRKFFYPSNFAPLWTESYSPKERSELGRRAAQYLLDSGSLEFLGGVPASLHETGEQWDAPNAWAPLQSIVILGLDKTGNRAARELARLICRRFLDSLMQVTHETDEFFEKYNARFAGVYGSGGEYEVQTGFGWTNGVALELIDYYYVSKRGLSMDKLNTTDGSAVREIFSIETKEFVLEG